MKSWVKIGNNLKIGVLLLSSSVVVGCGGSGGSPSALSNEFFTGSFKPVKGAKKAELSELEKDAFKSFGSISNNSQQVDAEGNEIYKYENHNDPRSFQRLGDVLKEVAQTASIKNNQASRSESFDIVHNSRCMYGWSEEGLDGKANSSVLSDLSYSKSKILTSSSEVRESGKASMSFNWTGTFDNCRGQDWEVTDQMYAEMIPQYPKYPDDEVQSLWARFEEAQEQAGLSLDSLKEKFPTLSDLDLWSLRQSDRDLNDILSERNVVIAGENEDEVSKLNTELLILRGHSSVLDEIAAKYEKERNDYDDAWEEFRFFKNNHLLENTRRVDGSVEVQSKIQIEAETDAEKRKNYFDLDAEYTWEDRELKDPFVDSIEFIKGSILAQAISKGSVELTAYDPESKKLVPVTVKAEKDFGMAVKISVESLHELTSSALNPMVSSDEKRAIVRDVLNESLFCTGELQIAERKIDCAELAQLGIEEYLDSHFGN